MTRAAPARPSSNLQRRPVRMIQVGRLVSGDRGTVPVNVHDADEIGAAPPLPPHGGRDLMVTASALTLVHLGQMVR